MDRMKTFLKYALWVIGFFILSEFLINVGLNSTYKKMERIDNNTQISVYQAEATYVNGRIRGTINNPQGEKLQGKFLKIEIYSKRDVLLGKQYIEINDIKQDGIQAFEFLFKAQDVKKYKVEIVNEKELETETELEIIPKEMTRAEILLATALTFLIFWA